MGTLKQRSVLRIKAPLSNSFALALLLTGCQVTQEQKKEIDKAFGTGEFSGSVADTNDPDPGQPTPMPSSSAGNPPGGGGGDNTNTPGTPQLACFSEKFQQPDEQISRSVDLLFIADTSGSMQDNRVRVADGLYAFVGELPAGTDYRIGMMVAHSSRSPLTGRLWGLNNTPVLDSTKSNQGDIQNKLRDMMKAAPEGPEQGEMGMFSLLQGLRSNNVAESRKLGFFRQDAALAVVFISDENDICAVYPAGNQLQTGLVGPIDKVGSELYMRNRDCKDGIAAEYVIQAIREFQGDRPFMFGAVVNNDITLRYNGNDGYGWGYMDVVEKSKGVSVDIERGNMVSGLSNIGQLVTRKLNLILSKQLQHTNVDPSSIKVYVDNIKKDATYVSGTNEVHFTDAGHAKSNVEINYCEMPGTCEGAGCGGGGGGGIIGI